MKITSHDPTKTITVNSNTGTTQNYHIINGREENGRVGVFNRLSLQKQKTSIVKKQKTIN